MKKACGLSVRAIGFAILIIGLDFAVIRDACLIRKPGEPGNTVPLRPGMVSGRLIQPSAVRIPMGGLRLLPSSDDQCPLDRRLRLPRRGAYTAATVGFVIVGSAATCAVFTSCLIWPEAAIGMVWPISRPIAVASFNALARLSGHGELLYRGPLEFTFGVRALEWTYVVIFAVLIPIAFFCIPPLLVAVIGGRIARYLDVAGTSLPGPPRHGPER